MKSFFDSYPLICFSLFYYYVCSVQCTISINSVSNRLLQAAWCLLFQLIYI